MYHLMKVHIKTGLLMIFLPFGFFSYQINVFSVDYYHEGNLIKSSYSNIPNLIM